MVLCLVELPRRFSFISSSFPFLSSFHFWSSFIFDLHFIFVSSFCCCSSFVDVLHSHLLFDIILHPSVDYRLVFTLILYFQSSPSQNDSQYFHFQLFGDLLTLSATVLSGHFLLTGAFYLTLIHQHFWLNLRLPRPPSLRAASSSLKCAGQHTDPWNTDPAHLFVWFTVIHKLHIQNNSYLNSTIY